MGREEKNEGKKEDKRKRSESIEREKWILKDGNENKKNDKSGEETKGECENK